jgi:hypothetical protein
MHTPPLAQILMFEEEALYDIGLNNQQKIEEQQSYKFSKL